MTIWGQVGWGVLAGRSEARGGLTKCPRDHHKGIGAAVEWAKAASPFVTTLPPAGSHFPSDSSPAPTSSSNSLSGHCDLFTIQKSNTFETLDFVLHTILLIFTDKLLSCIVIYYVLFHLPFQINYWNYIQGVWPGHNWTSCFNTYSLVKWDGKWHW